MTVSVVEMPHVSLRRSVDTSRIYGAPPLSRHPGPEHRSVDASAHIDWIIKELGRICMPDQPRQPRISPLPVADDAAPRLNIFRTLGRNRSLLKAFLTLGGRLLGEDSSLPVREREIVILRTGFRSESEYEFSHHSRLGERAGLSADEISGLAEIEAVRWTDNDEALIDMVDELCDSNIVSEVTWTRLQKCWSDAQLLELLVLAGYYRLVSGMLNSIGVALEPDSPGWPSGVTFRSAPRDR
jgi:4-carboxymuconolactone decarboxylase